jgi:D-ribose pyranose/furanose isomerase RbsD
MRKLFLGLSLLVIALLPCAAQTAGPAPWRAKLAETLPLLGHRNWILIVDSAYPLQVSPGVETIETGASQVEVVQAVLHAIDRSIHVRPVITMDAELPFVPEQDAPGVTAYRSEISDLLRNYAVSSLPHQQLLAQIGQTGAQYQVLVLKTTMAIPYTSVFIRLDCKYWSDDAEQRLRAKMGATN